MKNTTVGILAFFIIFLFGGYIYFNSEKSEINTITGNVINNLEAQKVILSEKDLNYYPSEVKVKANQPVSISLDDKVKGCLRAITIRDLGLSKYLKTTSETLDFTPTEKGTFAFSCSMGMGYGKLVVE